jgi:hypothetical protein
MSANPLNFLGGMILELGAAIGVIALLWQSPQADQQPMLPTASYYAPQEIYPPSDLIPVARFEPRVPERRDDFAYERPSYRPYMPAMNVPHVEQDRGELLPPAPATFNSLPARAPHVAVARPYVRTLREERTDSQPILRTAQPYRSEYYSRY